MRSWLRVDADLSRIINQTQLRTQTETLAEIAEVSRAECAGAETVLADDHAIAGGLAIDLAQQTFGGLGLEPGQAMGPEGFGVAGEEQAATRATYTQGFL